MSSSSSALTALALGLRSWLPSGMPSLSWSSWRLVCVARQFAAPVVALGWRGGATVQPAAMAEVRWWAMGRQAVSLMVACSLRQRVPGDGAGDPRVGSGRAHAEARAGRRPAPGPPALAARRRLVLASPSRRNRSRADLGPAGRVATRLSRCRLDRRQRVARVQAPCGVHHHRPGRRGGRRASGRQHNYHDPAGLRGQLRIEDGRARRPAGRRPSAHPEAAACTACSGQRLGMVALPARLSPGRRRARPDAGPGLVDEAGAAVVASPARQATRSGLDAARRSSRYSEA